MAAAVVDCPFCGFNPGTEYAMLLHMETLHSEGKSPFIPDEDLEQPKEATPSPGLEDYAECPIEGCGELVPLTELDDHVELHGAEQAEPGQVAAYEGFQAHDDVQVHEDANGYVSPYVDENADPMVEHAIGKQQSAIHRWKQLLNMPASLKHHHDDTTLAEEDRPRKRLGKSELGRYAHEDQMPDWLVSMLRRDGQIACAGVIPILEQLLRQNSTTRVAYLCHPSVQHVSKLKKEGGFCGYRNIQMLSSYIIGSGAPGSEHFRGKLPSIFKIQDWIESAWDRGINAQGRVETGGVRGTRKYIGTPEAQAVFTSLDVPCEAQGFKDPIPGAAEALLLKHVQAYFESGDYDPHDKVRCTSLPPIYFQHRGHSLTIIGIEKRQNGSTELLVFDPTFHDSPSITRHVGRKFHYKAPDSALKLYRRGNKYLKKYHEFEILKLRPMETVGGDSMAIYDLVEGEQLN